MRYLLLYLTSLMCCFAFFSCEPEIIEVKTMNHTRPIEVLKELVLIEGDSVAYNELMIAYLSEEYREEYLVYSLFMIHQYNYPRAYSNVYSCLERASESYGNVMDERTKEMALKYLRRGAELNDYNSLSYLWSLYLEGKYVPKDTIMSQKIKNRMGEISLLKVYTTKD
ncbi:hypothetical protein [Bacteroides reticulotermitis]|uniref:hypothetical protein n=1 Tax=Bacteroides reticulotermitis TaxID=1133319 RepID=UPI003A8B6E61